MLNADQKNIMKTNFAGKFGLLLIQITIDFLPLILTADEKWHKRNTTQTSGQKPVALFQKRM